MNNIVIIGATSAIAKAVARQLANSNTHLFLVARDEQKLEQLSGDLQARSNGQVTTMLQDIAELDSQLIVDRAAEALTSIDLLLVAHGTLPDQKAIENDPDACLAEIHNNGLSVVSICTVFARVMESQGAGTIAVISSVAGDRGRQSNYVYGAAKALVSTYLQGLRNRLSSKGVHVLTIKPGFVNTPMTAHIENKGALWAEPQKVAEDIVKAIKKKKNIIYTPFFWRYIMLIIKSVPEFIFKKLSL